MARPTTTPLRKKIQHYSFSLSDRIGKGYSSNVYKGLNEKTKQAVAIKVIELKSLRDEVTKGFLRTELECIKVINHPNILKYLDSYETVNNCYIMTELCEEGDLDKQLRSKGTYTEKQVMEIFRQMLDAYLSFHKSGFIHRDLKPANILLKQKTVKLADFGFVKRLSEHPKQNYNVGTPIYMSPESLKSNIYTQKTDIWSLGVICYQLMHGRVPWYSNCEKQLKQMIHSVRPAIDQGVVSADLENLIMGCLELEPTNRLSLSQIQDHPWVQRIYPRKDPCRLPFADLSNVCLKRPTLTSNQSTNQFLLDYEKQSANTGRITMDSLPSEPKGVENKQQVEKPPIDYLIAILNLMRFEFKVFKFMTANRIFMDSHVVDIMQAQILRELSRHENLVQTKANVFNINQSQWLQFVGSSQWKVYTNVVAQYSYQYRQQESLSSKTPAKDIKQLKNLLPNLYAEIRSVRQSPATDGNVLYRNLECLDYLVCIYKLDELVLTEGWLAFAKKSPINKIVECKCQVNQRNSEAVIKQLGQKINQL